MKWTVAVASFKRAGGVTTDQVVNNCRIVVPDSQVKEYRKHRLHNGARIVAIPDEQDGNLCRKRNAILDMYQGNVVILDDDYSRIGFVEGGVTVELPPDGVDRLFENGFQMCRDLGTAMWGLNQQSDPKFYREYAPFSMLSPILGPFQAFASTPFRYDETLWLKEDYDMSLRHLLRFHRILRFNKFHYLVNHINKSGGQVSMRTKEEEVRQIRLLQKRWGTHVVRWNEQRQSINPRVRVPLKGI
jgi:hypothetical protein